AARRRHLEAKLDEAIFDLYGLDESEIDLVRDMCEVGLDFYYNRDESDAVKRVASSELSPRAGNRDMAPEGPLGDYVRVLIQSWVPYLDAGTELHWGVHLPRNTSSMLAVVFTIHDIGDIPTETGDPEHAWDDVLRRLDAAMRTPMSSRIYIEGLARAVSDDGIIIIKRNERRLWTKTMAREDAEATLVQAMRRESLVGDGRS
ncbi:MAG TPA: N-6 DNA methylase, partial [Sumerlaeia bacterium]|nr:N-6 DNA methylase [Sumerlaeia bacterium]